MSVALSLRHALRSLRRTPVFTATATLTLVIGIGSVTAIFALLNGVLLRPLPYGHPDRLVGAWHDMPPLSMTHAMQTSGTYLTYKKLARSITGIAIYDEGAVNVAERGAGAEPQRLSSAWISANLFPILEVSPTLGRSFIDSEDAPKGPSVVIISEGLWRTRFGADRGVIGRMLDVNGVAREVVGVMPATFHFPSLTTQLWLPLALDPNDPNGGGFNYRSVARLKAGVTVAEAQQDFTSVLPRILEISPSLAPGVSTQMLLDQAKPQPVLIPLREDISGGIARTLWMVAAAALLVLLVACANVANLILVRADGRQRELAVRAALGAGRSRVLLHFLAESVLLSATAGALGLALAALAIGALRSAGPAEIPRLAEVRIDGAVVLCTLVLVALVGLVCAAFPALRLGGVELGKALREGGRSGTGRSRHRLRGGLVVAQIALALVVLAGSGLLVRTFQRLSAIRPGFDPEHVATFWLSLPQARYANDSAVVRFYARLTERITELPGVRDVGLASRLPLMSYGMSTNPFYAEGDLSSATKIPPLQINTTTDGGYFRAMGIPLVAGRTFDRLERQRALEAIVSLTTAKRFWPDGTGQQALGKRFRNLPNGPLYTIIGVVADARDTALAAPPSPTVYFPEVVQVDSGFGQLARAMALVVRSAGDPAAMTQPVQRAVRELDPSLPIFDVRPMTTVVRGSMAQLSFTILVLGAAAGVTLLLGAIGLYGVMAYIVTLRTRELGVRIALGAQPRAVAAMMARQGLALTGWGVGGGLLLFALVARFLRSFLFGVAPGDPLTLATASLLLVAIAALASWIPARRAARADPMEALRAE
jgi:predicted permease